MASMPVYNSTEGDGVTKVKCGCVKENNFMYSTQSAEHNCCNTPQEKGFSFEKYLCKEFILKLLNNCQQTTRKLKSGT